MDNLVKKFEGSLFGMAVCDAYGTSFEFKPRSSINASDLNREDFMGGGAFKLMPGMWTDDTSLGLIMAESLLDFYTNDKQLSQTDLEAKNRTKEVFGAETKMVKELSVENTCLRGRDIVEKYGRWYNQGHFSANGECFDIGMTTRKYLMQNKHKSLAFCTEADITDSASGNGALMRLTTVPLYFYGLYLRNVREKNLAESDEKLGCMLHRVIEESGFSSMTTHPSQIAIDCNRYMAALIIGALQNATKEELLQPMFVPNYLPKDYWKKFPLREEVLKVVRDCSYKTKSEKEIKNSGFSVAAFEAALWAFFNHGNLMDGLFNIARLGDDSDTVAAIYGQVAGAYYGIDAIPQNFVRKCTFSSLLHVMAGELLAAPDSSNSFAYENLMRLFDEMEAKYEKINRKISPSPNQFASMDDYQQAVSKFENSVNELISNRVNGEMIKGYQIDVEGVNRFKDAAEKLLNDFIKRAEFASKSLRAQLNAVTAKKDLLDSIRK